MKSSVVRLSAPSGLFVKHLYWPISSISTLWICREPFFRREYLSPSREPSGSSLLLQNKHWTLQSSSEIEAHGKGLYWNDYRCSVYKTESNVAQFYFFYFFFLPRLSKLTKGFWKETFQRRKEYKYECKRRIPWREQTFQKAYRSCSVFSQCFVPYLSLNSLDPSGSLHCCYQALCAQKLSFTHNLKTSYSKTMIKNPVKIIYYTSNKILRYFKEYRVIT